MKSRDPNNVENRFVEPADTETSAGSMILTRPPTPYQKYMAAQKIPVHEAPGFYDVRDLELCSWDGIGANGAFLVPDGTLELLGMHVIEIPPGEALNSQKHLFEEKYWVVEGRGVTEVSASDDRSSHRFEWQSGSLFAIPINSTFRIYNASRHRALLIAGNTAPPVINIFDNLDFVFANDFEFSDRFSAEPDYFSPSYETLTTPELGRGMWRTSLIPDIVNCELPLDNQRSPGYRRIEPYMAGGNFRCFIGEHESGRYSKGHAHDSFAVLICVKGRGYTYNWPTSVGKRPWETGHGDVVERVDYVSGGMVAAAPGGGDWYHQHFPTGRDGLRILALFGGLPGWAHREYIGRRKKTVFFNANEEDGGTAIDYRNEDPHVRTALKDELASEGVPFRMPESLFG